MARIYPPSILSSRLRSLAADQERLAFCVGSGLTLPRVPGVADALKWMAAELQDSAADKEAFEATVRGKAGGEAYQSGADFLLGCRGQNALNGVVRAMVLNAHKPTIAALASGDLTPSDFDEQYCLRAEQDLEGWIIPRQVDHLARLLTASDTAGIVVTTNFDPLIQIAVRRAGGTAVTEIFDADGNLGTVDPGSAAVIGHLHGFWQRSDTLHVPAQLLRERDGLQVSLEDLLRERTILITGYGGWDDIFTKALVDAVRRHRAGDMNVIWTLFDDSVEALEIRHRPLFESVEFAPGRVTFFSGVSCEDVFEMLDEEPASGGRDAPEGWFPSPVEGFTAVTADFLSDQEALPEAGLIRFFDGQVSTWQVALAPEVPRLEAAEKVAALLAAGREAGELAVLLVEGPAGEGKSTVLRQAAVDCARSGDWRVLWREPGLPLHLDLGGLEQGSWRWLVAIDDGGQFGEDCLRSLRQLHEAGRTDVHFLLASQTNAWRTGHNTSRPWATYGRFETVQANGMSEQDARALVSTWSAAGAEGLGRLVDEPVPERRALRLSEAAQKEALSGDGCLLGAMLQVRYGDGLRDHVRVLGERLQLAHLRSGKSLLEAFLYVACLHAHGITTLPPEALAEALEIPLKDLYREVLWPLGEEAALTSDGAHLVTRHRSIAAAASELADDWGEDIAEIYYEIIRGTVRAFRDGVYVLNLADIVYLPGRLLSNRRIAVRAAEAPADEEPERISYRTSLASTMRRAGRSEAAMELAFRTYSEAQQMIDPQELRGLLFEWAVCAGVAGKPALNAYLALGSLADEPVRGGSGFDLRRDELRERIAVSMSGLAVALDALAKQIEEPWIDLGRAATSELQRLVEGDEGGDVTDRDVFALEAVSKKLATFLEREEPPRAYLPPMKFEGLLKVKIPARKSS